MFKAFISQIKTARYTIVFLLLCFLNTCLRHLGKSLGRKKRRPSLPRSHRGTESALSPPWLVPDSLKKSPQHQNKGQNQHWISAKVKGISLPEFFLGSERKSTSFSSKPSSHSVSTVSSVKNKTTGPKRSCLRCVTSRNQHLISVLPEMASQTNKLEMVWSALTRWPAWQTHSSPFFVWRGCLVPAPFGLHIFHLPSSSELLPANAWITEKSQYDV